MNKLRIGGMIAAVAFAFIVPRVASRWSEKAASEAAHDAQIGAGPTEETENEKRGRKLSAYAIPCGNNLGDQIGSRLESYHRWAPAEAPLGPESRPSSVGRLSSLANCRQAATNAAQLEPRLADVEGAATALIAAAEALDDVLRRAAEYYREQNYKDDAFAAGNVLHAEINAKGTAAQAAFRAFRELTDRHHDRVTEQRLVELERTPGRRLQYLVTRAGRDALKLVELLDDAQIGEDAKLAGVDAAAFQQKAQEFEALVDELRGYHDSHPAERNSVRNASGYINALGSDFVPELKQMARRLRDGQPYAERELGNNLFAEGSIQGSPGALLRAYNHTVQSYNVLSFEVLTTNMVQQ